MIKTLLFDFDGTIADTIPSNEAIAGIFNRLGKTFGIKKEITKKDVDVFKEKNLFAIITDLKIPFYKLPFITKRIRQELKQDIDQAVPIPGMEKAIKGLKNAGFSLSIVTSNKKDVVEGFLKRNNLEFFDFVHSENNLFGKGRVIAKFIQQHKLTKAEVIYIGDEIRDIDAAKKSGIKIASVTWGFNSKNGLEKHLPDYLIESPLQLVKIFS